MNSPIECKVVVTDGTRDARDLLVEASELPANRVALAMTSGAVWLQTRYGIRRLRRRSARLSEGDQLFLNYDETVLSQTTAPAELIKDGGRWSIWNKPPGMRAQGSKWGDHTTLGRYAEMHLEPRRESYIVHRLDLAARGLMLLAHDKKAAASLSGQFAARTVGKRYHAIVHGKFPGGDEAQVYTGRIDGKNAETTASRIRFDPKNDRSVLLVSIRTGRKHQIRRHLADAGFPIIGDRLHGRSDKSGSDFSFFENDPDFRFTKQKLKSDPDLSDFRFTKQKLKSDPDFSDPDFSDPDFSDFLKLKSDPDFYPDFYLCLVASRLTFDDPLTGTRVKCECIPREWL